MRSFVVVAGGFILVVGPLWGCGEKNTRVDPCTGGEPVSVSTDQLAAQSDEENIALGESFARMTFYMQHPNLSRPEACRMANEQLAIEAANALPRERVPDHKRAPTPGGGLSDAQIDQMTTYATGIGRAIGCGLDVDAETRVLAEWLNTNVPDRSARSAYIEVVKAGVDANARMQQSGRSPDSCAAVERELPRLTLR